MNRPNNWRVLLIEYVLVAEKAPFEYGVNDCALFAANAVKEMTGVDFAEDFRGKYNTALGAKKALKAAGYNSLEDLAADKFKEIPALTAKMGDLAILDSPDGPALGIVFGAEIATVSGRVHLTDIKKAYEIC